MNEGEKLETVDTCESREPRKEPGKRAGRRQETGVLADMGSELRWLERTPDKREVGGSSPLEPTMGDGNVSQTRQARWGQGRWNRKAKVDSSPH